MKRTTASKLWICFLLVFAWNPVAAHAGKYPGCIKGKLLQDGDKFSLQFELKGSSDGDLAKLLHKVGTSSMLRPSFPLFNASGMAIEFLVKPNPNDPQNPKELDRMARLEMADAAKSKRVAIFCD